MESQYILSDYINKALAKSVYDKLDDGTFSGKIPGFKGIIAFSKILKECESELRSTLEDWILVGLKLGHKLPIIAGLDLNKKLHYEPLDSM